MMRGGARPGAGRKKMSIKRQSHSFRLFDAEYFLLKECQEAIKVGTSFKIIFDKGKGYFEKIERKEVQTTAVDVDDGKGGSLTVDQERAYRLIMSGANCFITGGAGVGKSYLLKHAIDALEKEGKKVVTCAPTGIAARNIGGATLHHTLGIPIGIIEPKKDVLISKRVQELLEVTDVIVIDEISMVRVDVFDWIIKIIEAEAKPHYSVSSKKKISNRIQLVLCGDFCQLPPVINVREREAWQSVYPDNPDGFAFLSPKWQFKTVQLTNVVRQKDKNFAAALNEIRLGNEKGLTFINLHKAKNRQGKAISLCATNAEAVSENDKGLDSLSGKEAIYVMDKTGRVSQSDIGGVPKKLRLKVGCRIVLTTNNADEGYVNGEFATVKKLKPNSIIVKLEDDGKYVEIEKVDTSIEEYEKVVDDNGQTKLEKKEIGSFRQLPVRLGYAITIHRSQGQTYDKVNLKLGKIFATGQLYVALSRCRSINATYFDHKIEPKNLFIASEVKEFYQKLKS